MASSVTQRSFAAGEIAPALYARVDTVKYATGLKKLLNAYVLRHGGMSNRAGTKFLGEVSDSSKETVLIPFVFSVEQAFVLEFGDQYMRVIKDGAYIYEASKVITGITQANPAVVSVTAHGYSNGDEVYIQSVAGMTQVNNRQFKAAGVTANTFQLQYMDGTNVNSTAFTAYSSGGTVKKVYEIDTPYVEADLFDLRYTQSADVMTITNQNYPVYDLSRIADDNWSLDEVTFVPGVTNPTGISLTSAGGTGNNFRYTVTAIDPETREESLQGRQAAKTITGITQANPAVVSSTSHGYANGDQVYIDDVVGMTEVNGKYFIVQGVTANTFQLFDTDSSAYTAYSSGGSAYRTHTYNANIGARASNNHTLSWTAVSGIQEYNVYLQVNGVFYYIGTAQGSSFTDLGADPDYSITPPSPRNPFEDDYPASTGYYQQRKIYVNTTNKPEYAFASRTGHFKNFTNRVPLQDDDAVTFNLASGKINKIRSVIGLERLLLFTDNGVFRVNGNDAGVLTPSGINPTQISYVGASSLAPLVINNTALYVQSRGSVIRDLMNDAVEAAKGNELSLISAHLVDDYQIVSWAYQEIPHSVVWIVRDDGKVLSMTYVREQQIVGWAVHEFEGGLAECVCVIPGDTEDEVYFIVNRTIDGRTTRYVEQLNTRKVADIKDSIFMDSSLSYDGRHTGSTTMTLSGGTNWTASETLTLTASASTFASTDVGNQIHLTGSDGTLIRFSINAYTNATVVTGKAHKTVPVAMRSVAIATWAMAVDRVTGLWHLEGEDVSVLGDGFVEASPFNDAYQTVTVTDGAIDLSKHYAVIHVGLPYKTDLETLEVDTPQGETLQNKNRLVSELTVSFEKSRGGFYGLSEPDMADPLNGLQEMKLRSEESVDDPVDLLTGKGSVIIKSNWNNNGRVFVRQVDPLPMTILSITGEGLFPFKGGA